MAKKNVKRKNIQRLMLVLFLAALIILYIVIFVVPKVIGSFEETATLEYGDLGVVDSTEAFLVRDETLYVSNTEGKINHKQKEGTKVRKGVKLMDISPADVSPKKDSEEDGPTSEYPKIVKRAGRKAKTSSGSSAEKSGIISFYVDGYEQTFTPKNIEKIKKSTIAKVPAKGEKIKRKTTLKGDPIYKLTDNHLWYMVIWKDKSAGDIVNYEKGKDIKVDIGNTRVVATIKDIYDHGDDWMIIMYSDMYYKDLPKYRKTNIDVVFAEYQGLVVEDKSIVIKGEKEGLYVKKTSGKYEFTPIKRTASSGGKSVLAVDTFVDEDDQLVETVNYYDVILIDPKQIDEVNG